jgi:hypothetical protein
MEPSDPRIRASTSRPSALGRDLNLSFGRASLGSFPRRGPILDVGLWCQLHNPGKKSLTA